MRQRFELIVNNEINTKSDCKDSRFNHPNYLL